MTVEQDKIFDMSDEDFANLGPSSTGSSEEASASSSSSEEVVQADEGSNAEDINTGDADTNSGLDTGVDADASVEEKPTEAAPEEKAEDTANLTDEELAKAKPPTGKEPVKDGVKPVEADASKAVPKTESVKTEVVQAAPTSKEMKPEDLASFYDTVMAPFKANGKDFILRSPDEVIRLMKMGVGYGRKINDMQPHVKTLRMLEKNNLLDEAKISYLIDLDQKNPDAIKKLIKESGYDPLDLNTEDDASYIPSNHSVSDTEVVFAETLKDVATQPGGQETIQLINDTWDKTSKDALWAQPELLSIFQTQRDNGLYDQITAEIEHMKLLGDIKPNTPFIEAYRLAGDSLVNANRLVLAGAKKEPETRLVAPNVPAQVSNDQQQPRVLGTRIAAPKTVAANNDKAKAASSPQSSARKAKDTINPLDMADDEFIKQFNGRF